jgi:hypothetical protein
MQRLQRSFCFGLTLVVACIAVHAESMDNSGVVQMVRAKVPADVILMKIAETEPAYDVSPNSLGGLVQAGVPDQIIRAVAARQAGRPVPGVEAKPVARPTSPVVATAGTPPSAGPKGAVPGSRLFIAAMEGNLHGFIAAEIVKKKFPLSVTTDESAADYVLTGGSIRGDDKWFHTVFGGKDKNEGNIQLVRVNDRTLVWAGEAGDRSLWWGGIRRGGQRKVADRLVKQMKHDLHSLFE